MRILALIFKFLVAMVVILVAGAAGVLRFSPPELLQVAGSYSAKIVCSNVFVAGRNIDDVMAVDVQAPGHPVLKYFSAEKEGDDVIVTHFLKIFVPERAIFRPGLGCASVPDGDVEAARKVQLAAAPTIAPPSDFEWPLGDAVTIQTDPALSAIITNPAMTGPGMRAIVVVKDGRIIGEAYGPGFGPETPLLGWSMTKTVTAALSAIRVSQGQLSWKKSHLIPEWEEDGRNQITLENLMGMESGLEFNEDYGDVTDVTRMLFLEPDMAKFVASFPAVAKPGEVFNYSSGTPVVATRIWMDTFPTLSDALAWPRQALFNPIGMRSAILETDRSGTFVGGSMMYATARDWARFGLLLANGGTWNENRILPEDFMTMVSTPTASAKGVYTSGMAWKDGPLDHKNSEFGLPDDLIWALGHDGQSISILPSEHLVVVRMGLTPSKLGYLPQIMLEKIASTVKTIEPLEPASEEPPVQPEE